MKAIRVYDPERQPPNWCDIIRPDQFAAFAKRLDGGAPCDADGRPFALPADASCLLFDTIEEARIFCESRVQLAKDVAFEIFDGTGRVSPPLLIVVAPGRQSTSENSPRAVRLRFRAAVVLTAGALLMFWLDYIREGVHFVLSVIGVNMLVAAARLAMMNSSIRESEREREERLRRAMEKSS